MEVASAKAAEEAEVEIGGPGGGGHDPQEEKGSPPLPSTPPPQGLYRGNPLSSWGS